MEQFDEKLEHQKQVSNKKSPIGAAILSLVFPGVGLFYLGNFLKGLTYLLVFVSLIHLASHGYAGIFAIITVGFYIFQIFDSFDEANLYNQNEWHLEKRESMNIPLFISWIVLCLGVALLMANLDFLISYSAITKLWPVILIGLGIRTIYTYTKNKNISEGGENE